MCLLTTLFNSFFSLKRTETQGSEGETTKQNRKQKTENKQSNKQTKRRNKRAE
jgi:hypothetical protein